VIVELAKTKAAVSRRRGRPSAIEIPWRKAPSKRRREILIPESQQQQEVRPIRSENRATLVASIARGRRGLEELIADPVINAESIADREGCTARQVNMTISLAFLAPDLVKAAIQGQLPHGMGVRRLRDMPSEWRRQRQALGL
jgi:site-specific DNA recombinase